MGNAPIFIVGMNGSGTTMLADSLRRHPSLYVLPIESKVLPYFLSERAGFGDLALAENRRRLAEEIGRTMPYWHANGKRPLVLHDEELANCKTFGDVVSRIYEHLAAREGKLRWGDKSPMNVQHIGAIAAQFPASRFIHIIRDGRDAAQSFHRRWGFDPRHTIWRWKCVVRDGRRQGMALGPSRYLEVRYETLTAEPETEMRRICRFAELPFDAAVLESSMRFMDPGSSGARVGRMVRNSEKWRSYFNARTLATLESLAGRVLSELGYPVEQTGDHDLSRRQRQYLRIRDAVARTPYFFREYGVLLAIPRYVRYLAAARKQRSVSRY
ncbi:MAG TPA: sulfotransferase [Steroidobacteraceae bacterium]